MPQEGSMVGSKSSSLDGEDATPIEKVMVLEIVVPLEPPLNVTLKDLSEIASVADRKHWDVHFYEREKAR